MKRQWLVGALLVAGLALFVSWIARNTYWDEVTVPRLLRGEAATNPFYAIQRFVEELGAESEWRRTLGELPSTSSVLMLTHWNWDLIESRREQLQRWVESGGRLLLDGTLAGGKGAFEEWSGLSTEHGVREGDDAEEVGGEIMFGGSCRALDLTVGIAQSATDRSTYDVCGLAHLSRIEAARDVEWALEDNNGMQIARIALGRGKVILVNGTPFATSEMLEADNGALFVDAVLLHRGDHVVFLSEEDHPSILTLIWVYGAPAVLLALTFLMLGLWRNSIRFGPLEAPPSTSRRSLGEQIRGTGQFVFRTDGGRALHAAMVRALHEAARHRIPSYESLPMEDRMAAIARIAQLDADSLAETVNFKGSRSHHEFKQAIALLDTARAEVLARDASRRSSGHARAHVDSS